MYATILCCGWKTKSLHNIFSHIFTSMSNVTICGKTLDHWFYKVSSDIYRGVPPTLDDIQTDLQMVHLFLNSLSFHNTGLP